MKYFVHLLALLAFWAGQPTPGRAQAPTVTQALSLNPDNLFVEAGGRAVAVDAAGNQFVAGYFKGKMRLGATMLTAADTLAYLAKRDHATGSWLWAVALSGGRSSASGLGVDANGNPYLTGTFAGTASFATGTAAVSLTAAGVTDVFVARFNGATGTCVWAVAGGGTARDRSLRIAVDGSGEVYALGLFSGTARFTTSVPGATPVTTAEVVNVASATSFLARFSGSTGACIWAVRNGGQGASGLAADANGNVYVTGGFRSTATFSTSAPGSTPVTTTTLASAGYSAYLARYSVATGACLWAIQSGGASGGYGSAVTTDAAGNVYLAGQSSSLISLPGTAAGVSPVVYVTPPALIGKSFLARITPAGACTWVASVGGPYTNEFASLAVDGAGNLFATGYFYNVFTLTTSAPGVLPVVNTQVVRSPFNNLFVAKYSAATGAGIWIKTQWDALSSVGPDFSLALTPAGVPYVTSTFFNRLTLEDEQAAASNGSNMFVVALDPATGAWQQPAQPIGGSNSTVTHMKLDAAGNQYVTGSFWGSLQLGAHELASVGSTDLFIAKRSGSTGEWLWALRAGGDGEESGVDLTVDNAGALYLTGTMNSQYASNKLRFVTSPPGASPVTRVILTNTSDYEKTFIARFDAATGTCLWAVKSAGPGRDFANSLALDGLGHLAIAGGLRGASSFATSGYGVTPVTATAINSGSNYDLYVARFRVTDGACVWAVRAGGASATTTGAAVACGAAGQVVVSGSFTTTASFTTSAPGPGPATTVQLTSAGQSDAFLARFDPGTGACLWATRAGGVGNDGAGSLAVNAAGEVFLTGQYESTPAFVTSVPGSTPVVTTTLAAAPANNANGFLARLDLATGACRQVVRIGSTVSASCIQLVLDRGGSPHVTGNFQGTASLTSSLPGATLVAFTTLTGSGGPDLYVARFDAATLACVWAARAGGPIVEFSYTMDVAGNGAVYIGGMFVASTTLGSFQLTGNTSRSTAYLLVIEAPARASALFPAAELPGMPVTIVGSGFDGSSTVQFGAVAASNVQVQSGTLLTAIVPLGATGSTATVTTAGTAAGLAFTPLQVHNGPANTCVPVPPIVTVGDGQWHYMLSSAGRVVLAYNYSGAALGNFAGEVFQADATAPVRTDGQRVPYLDRNWHLTSLSGLPAGRSVALRFFGLPAEFARLQAADPTRLSTPADLRATHYSGPGEDCMLGNNSAASGQSSVLTTQPLSPQPAGTGMAAVGWFAVETTVSGQPGEFYLHAGTQPLAAQVLSARSAIVPAVRLAVHPNPARQVAYVTVPAATGEAVGLYDGLGREVRRLPVSAAGTEVALPLQGLPAGVYVLRGGGQAVRLVVE